MLILVVSCIVVFFVVLKIQPPRSRALFRMLEERQGMMGLGELDSPVGALHAEFWINDKS